MRSSKNMTERPSLTLNVDSQVSKYTSPSSYDSEEIPYKFETQFYGFEREFESEQEILHFKNELVKVFKNHEIDIHPHLDNLLFLSLFFVEIYDKNKVPIVKRKLLNDKAKFLISLMDSPHDTIKTPIQTTYYDLALKTEVTKYFTKDEFDPLSIEERVSANLLGDITRVNVTKTKYLPISAKIDFSIHKKGAKKFTTKIPLHNWDLNQHLVKALIDEQKENDTPFYRCLIDPNATLLDLWTLSKTKIRGNDDRWNFAVVGVGKLIVAYLSDNTTLKRGKAKFVSNIQAKFLFDYFIVLGLDQRVKTMKNFNNGKIKYDTLYDYLIVDGGIEPCQDVRTKFRNNQI